VVAVVSKNVAAAAVATTTEDSATSTETGINFLSKVFLLFSC
jgi:hypothetical protein